MKLILLPGWHEATDHMRIFINGRHGLPGLAQLGYDCVVYDGGKGTLRHRIEHFADFLTSFRSNRRGVPIGTFGYSAGGVIARGFLRAFPKRAGEIAASFQLAVPNAGVVTDELNTLLHVLKIDDAVIEDLDIESPFMRWLNAVPGHWQHEPGTKHKYWRLDGIPWIAPPGARILNLVGRMPRYRDRSDGIVQVESATLNDHLPSRYVDGVHANHLNLSGMRNTLATVFRQWQCTDDHWVEVVREAHRFFAAEQAHR